MEGSTAMSSEKYQIIFATGNQGKIREIKAIVEENKNRPVPDSQAEAGKAVPEIEVLFPEFTPPVIWGMTPTTGCAWSTSST